MMDIYSAKKIMTKDTDLNSVLNPLTNSDSPSEKSKGDRLVSAREVMKNRNISRKRKELNLESLGVKAAK